MSFCPNKSHPDWKALVNRVGETAAYREYILNGFDIPVDAAGLTMAKVETKVKEWLQKIGVTTLNVSKITDSEGKPMNAVAVAKMLHKTIEIVEGRADITTLPEEAAHFLVEMLGNENALVKSMMSTIESYPVYDQVYKEYFDVYKGDINKIKKEAIGKQIALQIVQKITNEELGIDETQREKFGSWWNRFWTKISSLFAGKVSASEVDAFLSAAEIITSGQYVKGDQFKDETYYQLDEQAKVVDALDNKIKIRKDENATNSKTKKPGTYFQTLEDGTEVERPNRVTDRVEKAKQGRGFNERSQKEQAEDEVRRNVGIAGHDAIQNIITRLVEEASGQTITQKTNKLDPKTYDMLESYFRKLLESYPAGTKFYSEKIVYNETTKEAGTIDFMAVLPDGSVDILDWKFIEFKQKGPDGKVIAKSVPWYKEQDYNIQITGYRQALRTTYGVTKIRKSRIIPISVEYNKGNVVTKVEIGSDPLKVDQDKPYLNPVPITGLVGSDVELTGDEKIDNLIHVLIERRNNIENKAITNEKERAKRQERLDAINEAIRELQVTGGIKAFIKDAKFELNYIANNKATLTDEDIVKALEVTKYYSELTAKGVLTAEQKKEEAEELASLIANAGNLHNIVREIAVERIKQIAADRGVTDINDLQPEGSMVDRLFGTISQSNHPIVKTFYRLVMGQKDKIEKETLTKNQEIARALEKLKEWGSSRSLSGTDLFKDILQYDKDGNWTGNLISLWSQEFFTKRTAARKDKDLNWMKENTTFDKQAFIEALEQQKEVWKERYLNEENGIDIVNRRIEDYNRKYNVEFNENAYFINNRFLKINEKWRSEAWKNLQKKENKPLLDFYNLFTNTISEFREFLPLDEHGNFIPNIKNDLVDQIAQNGFSSVKGLGNSIVQHLEANSDETIGVIDEITGERKKTIPLLYTKDLDAKSKSKDLGVVLSLFSNMAYNYKYMAEIEAGAHLLRDQLSNQRVILTNAFGKPLKSASTGAIATAVNSAADLEQFNKYMDYYLYGMKIQGKDLTFEVGSKALSSTKIFSKTLSYFSAKSLSFNLISGFANGIGGTANLFFEGMKGRFFSNAQAKKAYSKLIVRNEKSIALMKYFNIDSADTSFKLANNLSVSKTVKHMTLDKLYFLQKGGDWLVENGTLLSMLESHTLKDGKIVKKGKDDKSLHELAEIKDDKIVIDGLSEEEFNKFRRKVKYLYGTMKGNSNADDINGVRLTILGQMFMQFRNWIPRMAYERVGKLRYTQDLDVHEYGKYRSFFNQLINKQILPSIFSTLAQGGVLGFGKGLSGNKAIEARAKQLYAQKLSKNPNLKITEAEFIEMHKQNIRSTMLELQMLTAFALLIASLKGTDDDKDPTRRFLVRMLNRNMDEIAFWYNPDSASSILKKPIPIMSFYADIFKFTGDLFGEGVGHITGDEDRIARNRPVRRFNKLFPVSNAWETLRSAADPDYNKLK
jgi:hypothetical protein